ncbi:hypothetical protein DPMN_143496 [Dreissena polymorpha]|uniref:Uncharacterized protein n=1 Tax=Dreissena polymorpha TaxID=45954 RepID=A0A9D4GDP4_DREPO|nr:hypothetical protein DPMN_143496 [Dreissena polymorpha]
MTTRMQFLPKLKGWWVLLKKNYFEYRQPRIIKYVNWNTKDENFRKMQKGLRRYSVGKFKNLRKMPKGLRRNSVGKLKKYQTKMTN